MTNTPIDRINELITALEAIKDYALRCEREMRDDDPLADSFDAMIAALEMIEDDGNLLSPDDFDAIKALIMS